LDGRYSYRWLHNDLHKGDTIDIFQIAPTPRQHIGSENNLVLRLKNAVRKAFVDPLSVELCDANHVVAVLDALHHPNRTQFHPMVFKENPIKKVVEFADPDIGQMASGLLTLHGLRPAECLRLMMPFLSMVDATAPPILPAFESMPSTD
jgi:hypothetical protein